MSTASKIIRVGPDSLERFLVFRVRDALDHSPTLGEASKTWCRVALQSFGGPAAQVAVMHRIIVDEQKWISDEEFVDALGFCNLLPGPEAQQLATFLGWRMHGWRGGMVAGGLFILPGMVVIGILSALYVQYRQLPIAAGILLGLKAAVLAIVMQAILRLSRRVLRTAAMRWLALFSFAALLLLHLPFPAIVAIGAILGWFGSRRWPSQFILDKKKESSAATVAVQPMQTHRTVPQTLGVLLLGLSLWWTPLVAIIATLGIQSTPAQQGLFFSRAAVVTFGGAYAVLGYVQQQAVERYQWLEPQQMSDGLGLAETTPGPLIMVLQFVGYVGGHRQPGTLSPTTAALLGAAITTWVTFVPSFLWVFLGAPYVQRLRQWVWLRGSLSAINACVVGVIIHLGLWLALHTLFADVKQGVTSSLIHWQYPVLDSIQWPAVALTIIAFVIAFALRRSLFWILAVPTLLAILFHFVP
jgi:chromate transporter